MAKETGLAVILASLTMLISAPILVYATDSGTDGDYSSVLSQISRTVSDLQAQMTGLTSKFDTYSSKLDSLNSRVETMALANTDSNVTAPGVADCLVTCRKSAATCLSAKPISGETGIPTLMAISDIQASKNACLTQSGSCIQNCHPQSTSVSCDTSCAVQLGACIRGAGSDIPTIQACRAANESCLTSTCVPQAVSVGNFQASVTLILPPGTCQGQCTLEYSVCRQSARFDQIALDECGLIRRTCAQVACQGPTKAANPSTTTPTTGGSVPRNIACENSCTDTYYKCKQNAGSDQDVLVTCGNTYGTCRNQCLIQSGGGFGTGGATAPGM